jgi:ABC-type transport system involved in multi-copper enzyme maturation permease subunit
MAPDPGTVRRPFPILTGLGGLLRGELTRWLGRRGLIHLVVWTIGVQGLLYWDIASGSDPLADWRGFDLLIHLWWIACPLAAIGLAQNALVEERRNQTAPWVLSKPVTRSSFVVSKIVSDAGGLILIAVGLQGAIARMWLPNVEPATGLPVRAPDTTRYLVVMGIVALVVLMYVAMTVFLTTMLPWRGPAAAIGLITWILVWNAPSEFLERYTIGGLVTGELAGATMKPIAEYLVFETPLEPVSSVWWTAIAAIAFTIGAAFVFRREQF